MEYQEEVVDIATFKVEDGLINLFLEWDFCSPGKKFYFGSEMNFLINILGDYHYLNEIFSWR